MHSSIFHQLDAYNSLVLDPLVLDVTLQKQIKAMLYSPAKSCFISTKILLYDLALKIATCFDLILL